MSKTAIILFVFIFHAATSEEDEAVDNEDRPVLEPAELADLIFKEQMKMKTSFNTAIYKQQEHAAFAASTEHIHIQIPDTTEEIGDDAEMLKNRKVWSRWSKWSDCSVSCGEGRTARQRSCVAGLCARGEREEQHRPCGRAPCPFQGKEPSGGSE